MKRVWTAVDIVVALLLSAFAVFLVSGADNSNLKHSGAAASALVLTMTLPVAWRRRAPIIVAIVLGAGSLLNIFAIGHMIRCGPGLPALLLSAYAVGRFPVRLSVIGAVCSLGSLVVSATAQCLTDPQLQAEVLIVLVPMILGIFGAGVLVASRTRLASELEQRNAELRHQREKRAELAVEADRARIAQGLDEALQDKIDEIGLAAAAGRDALMEEHSEHRAQLAFEMIQERGRETLGQMREVVGTILERQPPVPQPSLSQLDRLLARGGTANVHLHLTGQPRVLPTGLELSAYRTLEYLLDAFGTDDGRLIDVEVDFTVEALGLTVRGPAPAMLDIDGALASIRPRIELHHGSLHSECPHGTWVTNIRLPLDASA
jgi:hypothetical protein